MDKLFSLLIPSRNRPQQLSDLCQSLHRTVKDFSRIEVLVATDNDCNVPIYKREYFPWLSLYSRHRINNISAYFNWLFTFSRGKFIWVLNDDVEMTTMNWDEILLSKLNPDKPCYGLTSPIRQEEV